MATEAVREPIATWWRISRYKPVIEPLKVVAFTASFVTYLEPSWSGDKMRERRENRGDIFPSFDIAKNEAIGRAEAMIASAKSELQRRRTFLGNLESLREPSL
jgi:hypothetical protein